MDLQIDETTRDLVLLNDELILLDGNAAIAQHLRIRLRFFLGEWFLDQRVGIPYFQRLLGEKPSEPAIRSIFRQAILGTPGILELTDLVIDFNGTNRVLSIRFNATTTVGEVLVFDEELIIL